MLDWLLPLPATSPFGCLMLLTRASFARNSQSMKPWVPRAQVVDFEPLRGWLMKDLPLFGP